MSETNNQYIKFMSDIIDSGLWGKLSPTARTLYPVLLKFSDQNFKQVWPSVDTLLKLTGFKTKKSISIAKKELIKEGLLYYKPGSGRTNSTYYFSFNYEGSKITPQWDKKIPLSGISQSHSEAGMATSQESNGLYPNHLNITINNTQTNKSNVQKDTFMTLENLMDIYGIQTVETALQLAKAKGLEDSMAYISGICKNICNKKPNFNQSMDVAQHIIDSWRNFLDWSKSHLTRSSVEVLEKIAIDVDGQSIFIKQSLSEFLKQIILKYFNEEVHPQILIIFSEQSQTAYSFGNQQK
jgi:hypothetical protein